MNRKRGGDLRFDLTRLKELYVEKEETTEYIVDGLLPKGGLSVAVAKPKTGKNTLARVAAKAVARAFLKAQHDSWRCDLSCSRGKPL